MLGARILPGEKGQTSTPENPCNSPLMLWIRDTALKYEGSDCLIWPFSRNTNGYARIARKRKNFYAHRYICTLTHGEPPTPSHQAAHSCDNGHHGCVNPRHLSWKTGGENQLDRHRTGPWRKFKLTPAQAEEVRCLKGKEPTLVTAQRYGISEAQTRHIQAGRARTTSTIRQFTDDEVISIRTAAKSATEIAADYGVSTSTIYRIKGRKAYAHVSDAVAQRESPTT